MTQHDQKRKNAMELWKSYKELGEEVNAAWSRWQRMCAKEREAWDAYEAISDRRLDLLREIDIDLALGIEAAG